MAITRHRQPLAVALAAAKHQVGRRLFFEARLVAIAIDANTKDVSSTDGTNTQS